MSIEWIEQCLALPKATREQPINVAHLKLLTLIAQHPEIRTDDLLPYFHNEKPTLISRINTLASKGLINKLPKFNAGGNTHPNYYTCTPSGQTIANAILGRHRT